jgi:hypothetical protein
VAGLLLLLWLLRHAALLGLALVVVLLTLRLLRRHASALLGRTIPLLLLLLRARRRVLEPKPVVSAGHHLIQKKQYLKRCDALFRR